MSDIEVIVKSFRRFGALERFVRSVRQFYPNVHVLIADDSFEVHPIFPPKIIETIKALGNITWVQMPFDSGIAAGRNRLVAASSAPMLVLCDDDFIFTQETQLFKFEVLLQRFDLVAGVVCDQGRRLTSPGKFQFRGVNDDELHVLPADTRWESLRGVNYRSVDMALNFFAAQREVLQQFPWDERFKITGEHLDFFLTLHRNRMRVVHTPDVTVEHARALDAGYLPYRCRQATFRPLLARKWRLTKLPEYTPYIEELIR